MNHPSRGYALGEPANPGQATSIAISNTRKFMGPPSIAIGEGTAALPGEMVFGSDQYTSVWIAGRLVWSQETGFAWEKEMDQLKAVIRVQQMHIDELFKAIRQNYDSDQVMLPDDLQKYLESKPQ